MIIQRTSRGHVGIHRDDGFYERTLWLFGIGVFTLAKPRPARDQSTKPYEVQKKEYCFDKYTRKRLLNTGYRHEDWSHCRYYNTDRQAVDAIRDLRRSPYDVFYRDYPGTESESKYPHIKPRIKVCRYRIAKR